MEKKLKCAILDDELPGLSYLKLLCEKIPSIEVVKAFADPRQFMDQIQTLEVDFCILDIEMPYFNGLQVAELIKEIPVIFSTAYRDYAPEAFDLNAVDYLRKPISQDRLQQAIEKVREKIKPSEPKIITFNTPRGKTLIAITQIGMVLTSGIDSRDKVIYLIDGTRLLIKNTTLVKLLSWLPGQEVVQVNKGELIRTDQIKFFTHDEITTRFTDEHGKTITLQLSEKYRPHFLESINP